MTQLKPAIGYVVSPGSVVIEKLVGLTLVFCAAAAVAPATLAVTNLPLAFLSAAWCMPFVTTYASSTYPIAPLVEATACATAEWPLAPTLEGIGHLTDFALPTVVFHSGDTLLR